VQKSRARRPRRRLGYATVVAVLGSIVVVATGAQAGGSPTRSAGPMQVMPARGHAPASATAAGVGDLLYHGGPVMVNGAAVTPIFWGKSWGSDPQNKKGWLVSFYQGMSGSQYAGTNSEYTQGGGAHVGTAITVAPALTDLSKAPKHAPKMRVVLSEVAKVIPNPVSNGYYPVYTDAPRGRAQYCAWHSWGTVNGVQVQFSFFFELDGDPGCDPNSSGTVYSQGVAALANMSGRTLSEALTDPHQDAWYDSTGVENADKCAWTFGRPLLTFSNGTQWKVQGNYSNAAAAAGSGYDGGGCIDGG
jgi:hypothetical protein